MARCYRTQKEILGGNIVRLVDADWILNHLPDDLPYKDSVKRVLLQAPEIDAILKPKLNYDGSEITK